MKTVILRHSEWEFPWALYCKTEDFLDIIGNYKTRALARLAARTL